MQLDPSQLTALAYILRLGSFDAAAGALGVTPSAISQRLKALEEKVGATLVHRASPCRATLLGARLAKHAEDIALLEASALSGTAAGVQTNRRLTLAVPADSLATWLMPALGAVDGMLFDLRLEDQDNTEEWLRNGSVSAAVTAQKRAAPGCDVHALGAHRYLATASPAFVQRYFPRGVTPESLAQAPVLTFSQNDQLQHRWMKENFSEDLHPPSHQLPSSQGFVDGAVCGLGWGMNPLGLVQDHIAAGRLVALRNMAHLDVALYWQVARVMALTLAPLTQSILRTARKYLEPAP